MDMLYIKIIGVGFCALLVLPNWAMREPQGVGRVTRSDSCAFSLYVLQMLYKSSGSGSLRAHRFYLNYEMQELWLGESYRKNEM